MKAKVLAKAGAMVMQAMVIGKVTAETIAREKEIIEARALAAMLEGRNQHSSPSEKSHEGLPIRTDEAVVSSSARAAALSVSRNVLKQLLSRGSKPNTGEQTGERNAIF